MIFSDSTIKSTLHISRSLLRSSLWVTCVLNPSRQQTASYAPGLTRRHASPHSLEWSAQAMPCYTNHCNTLGRRCTEKLFHAQTSYAHSPVGIYAAQMPSFAKPMQFKPTPWKTYPSHSAPWSNRALYLKSSSCLSSAKSSFFSTLWLEELNN